MRFLANERRWWTRGPAAHEFSLQASWLPLVALGGLLTALVLPAWRPGGIGAEEASARSADNAPVTRAAPPADAGQADFHQLPAVRISLRSDALGRLAAIALEGRPVRDALDLRSQIRAFLGSAEGATVEAELECDSRLRYDDARRVIDTIAAYPAADGRPMVPLVDRVRFSARHTGKQ